MPFTKQERFQSFTMVTTSLKEHELWPKIGKSIQLHSRSKLKLEGEKVNTQLILKT